MSHENHMKLNPKKGKELGINLLRDPPVLPQLTIDGIPIEVIVTNLLLGLQG